MANESLKETTFMQNEGALIDSLQRRDPQALAALFERYANPIYRLAARLLNDEQQADGVVQNTFMALIEHIDQFEGRSGLGTWLYRVAYNECMGRIRAAAPLVELEPLVEGELLPTNLIDWDSVPESVVLDSESRQQMAAAIESLPPTLRAVFILRDVEELSVHETATALGLSEAAVKVYLHRARLHLRERLAGYFGERRKPAER
jgi:RNA polymerase sigma-70 factor (ECF subfamily)